MRWLCRNGNSVLSKYSLLHIFLEFVAKVNNGNMQTSMHAINTCSANSSGQWNHKQSHFAEEKKKKKKKSRFLAPSLAEGRAKWTHLVLSYNFHKTTPTALLSVSAMWLAKLTAVQQDLGSFPCGYGFVFLGKNKVQSTCWPANFFCNSGHQTLCLPKIGTGQRWELQNAPSHTSPWQTMVRVISVYLHAATSSWHAHRCTSCIAPRLMINNFCRVLTLETDLLTLAPVKPHVLTTRT